MPRYFFHTRDGIDVVDEVGTELPNLAVARRQAVMCAGELMRDHPDSFLSGADWTMTVADESGFPLATLTFRARLAQLLVDA